MTHRPSGSRRLLIGACMVVAALLAHGQAATATRPSDAALPGTPEGGWTSFRGDARNTGVSHGRVPLLAAVRWRFIADSELLNSPAVLDGTVYFGSRGGRLYAVSAKTGNKVWERLHAGPAGPNEERFSGFTFSGPLLHGGRIYIGSEDGHLYCVSQKNGDLVWRRHLGGSGDSARVWASPKTDGRVVFIGSNAGFLWALDLDTGEPRWKAWIGDEIGSTVALLGSDLYVTAKDRRLHVLDAATGTQRWRVDLGGWSMSAPALALGYAFVRASGGKIVCVDLVNKSVRWTAELPPASFAQTSLAHDGELAYVTNGGILAAVGPDGVVVWQDRSKLAFDASPVVVGPYVVVAGNDRILRMLDRKTGAKAKELDLGDKLIATPTIVDGIVYVPASYRLPDVPGSSGTMFAVE